MTFGDQVRWCRRWGVVALLAGVAPVAILAAVPALDPMPAGRVLRALWFCLTAFGILAALMGGVLRPLHRRLYLALVAPDPFWHRLARRSRLARLWFWLSPDGRPRDD